MIATSLLILALGSQGTAPPAIERCRSAHAGDAAAHIACLENALRSRSADVDEQVGLDQVKQRERDRGEGPPPAKVRIVSIGYDSRGFGTFRMADGQVWRETEANKRRPELAPGGQYDARIEHGRVGGYRMYVDGIRWMYKVQRLE
jgi:hypothetical protein